MAKLPDREYLGVEFVRNVLLSYLDEDYPVQPETTRAIAHSLHVELPED